MAASPDSQTADSLFDAEFRPAVDSNATPITEFSPPDSPALKTVGLMENMREKARKLAASLSLEEQVRSNCCKLSTTTKVNGITDLTLESC